MDQNGGSNQNLAHNNQLCRSGCGFYGNPAFEGMCSKCYKDSVKRRQQNPSPTQVAGRATPTASVTSVTSRASESVESRATRAAVAAAVDTTILPSVETATPTVPSTASPDDKPQGSPASSVSSSDSSGSSSSGSDKKPKKNRCHTCKKKVGLTGFECRCGGLYCGLHRYSDKHECTFDYKELAQQQIRKANPVVVGEKINKI